MSNYQIKLPDKLIIGPMRTGTSWVYKYLKNRSDIRLPRGVKETFFFDRNYSKGLEWYASHFRSQANGITVEVGSSYFHSKKATARILDTIGKISIVVIKRDPVERSYSHFKHLVRYGYTSDDIHNAIKEYPEIISASRYAYHISRWQENFGEENVHIFDFSLIARQPRKFLEQLCFSLDINYKKTSFSEDEKVNEGKVIKGNWFNGAITSIADIMRTMKVYSIINFAKSMGLKKVIYGGNDLDKDEDSIYAKEIIKKELQKCEVSHV